MFTMAAEMQSFMWKMSHLCHDGIIASLNVNSCGGRMFISLNADLRNLLLFNSINQSSEPQNVKTENSRSRRRKRRRKENQQKMKLNEGLSSTVNQSIDSPDSDSPPSIDTSDAAVSSFSFIPQGDGNLDGSKNAASLSSPPTTNYCQIAPVFCEPTGTPSLTILSTTTPKMSLAQQLSELLEQKNKSMKKDLVSVYQ